MTDTREPRVDVSTRTRAGDRGRWACVRAWWSKWGELIKGVSGIAACVGCVILGALMYFDNAQTAQLTRDQCHRSLALGPSLAADYERRRVLTGKNLALYRSLIPTSCPK